MRFVTFAEALEAHERTIRASGGQLGFLNLAGLQSALAQPRMTFGGADLYETPVDKAAALAHSLIQNHPYIDGNKRTAHALMEVFLLLNGHELEADVDEQEGIVLGVAAGELSRDELARWLSGHVRPSATKPAPD